MCYGFTRQEYEAYKAKAYVRHDVADNRQKFQKNSVIGDAEIAYLRKAMEAPDVNLFVRLV